LLGVAVRKCLPDGVWNHNHTFTGASFFEKFPETSADFATLPAVAPSTSYSKIFRPNSTAAPGPEAVSTLPSATTRSVARASLSSSWCAKQFFGLPVFQKQSLYRFVAAYAVAAGTTGKYNAIENFGKYIRKPDVGPQTETAEHRLNQRYRIPQR
jgi:hypothetical protein